MIKVVSQHYRPLLQSAVLLLQLSMMMMMMMMLNIGYLQHIIYIAYVFLVHLTINNLVVELQRDYRHQLKVIGTWKVKGSRIRVVCSVSAITVCARILFLFTYAKIEYVNVRKYLSENGIRTLYRAYVSSLELNGAFKLNLLKLD